MPYLAQSQPELPNRICLVVGEKFFDKVKQSATTLRKGGSLAENTLQVKQVSTQSCA